MADTNSEYMTLPRAENVGVIAADVYFPSTFVAQSALEECDGVPAGKYTKGLGQEAMAVCDSREDINSICLTVVHSIMDKYDIGWDQIGRLEVGTETLVDKSKSVKSTLMQLFEARGCHEIEGVDTINACYGGTSALFNALAWCESSAWDGRYALVVAADIAVYDRGAARPTGGVGAVAMLVGPDAALVIEPGLRGTHMEHAFDFYKPQMVSEYPTVDGHLSNACYIRALDNCFGRYARKFEARVGRPFDLHADVDYAIFHQPYAKLVQKSWARLHWNDYVHGQDSQDGQTAATEDGTDGLREFLPIAGTEESMGDRALEKAAVAASGESFNGKVAPSMVLGKQVGNSYCGSLYNGMASLVDQCADAIDAGFEEDGQGPGKRVLMFSYGSGLAASMFSVRVRKPVARLREAMDIQQRLAARTPLDADVYHDTVDQRERDYTKFDYEPETSVDHYFPGTYYLDRVDELHRRTYRRTEGGASRRGADLYVKRQTASAGGTGSRGLFTSSRSGLSPRGVHHTVADPFNMCLDGATATASTNTASGYHTASGASGGVAATIADPFNMLLDPATATLAPARDEDVEMEERYNYNGNYGCGYGSSSGTTTTTSSGSDISAYLQHHSAEAEGRAAAGALARRAGVSVRPPAPSLSRGYSTAARGLTRALRLLK